LKLSNFDIRHLRVFLAVVECNGFSAAESLLGISQSTISTHIAELERRLGYQICKRGRSGFEVTERGRDLHASTLKLVDAFVEFEDKALVLKGAIAGRCRLALIDNLITDPRCPIIPALRSLSTFERGPRISIDVLSPAEIELAVAAGRVDLGISIVEKQLASLRYTPLYRELDVLVCGAAHPLFAVHDDDDLRSGVSEAPKVIRAFLNHSDLFPIGNREELVAGTVTSVEAAAYLVLAGTHIGFLPEHYVSGWIERGDMRIILKEEYVRTSEIVLIEPMHDQGTDLGVRRLVKELLAPTLKASTNSI
jgi:LysR family transcriptional regulator, transcriptional activator for bauABCD operon